MALALQQVEEASQEGVNARLTNQGFAALAGAVILALCVARADAPSETLATFRGFDVWWWVPLILLSIAFVCFLIPTIGSGRAFGREPLDLGGQLRALQLDDQLDALLLH